ncbi:hypothetical protein LTR37_015714 [Vermiconidia calcicola]|uniref:Uncharacterized protein n=1 Tax=Vermiconidia calcicola TaxID=1690605 RepID=A0ACC3MSP0_9PEZI|nr:hypothetical protein LTR37_015714 [Vermiconidia calcicola]
MPAYQATHIPYGLTDPSKRVIVNPGIQDRVEFLKYGIETGGEYFFVRTLVKPGGGVPIHKHATYGETFYPVHGEIAVVGHNGTKTMMLSPESNDPYVVKPGEWHRFFNPSETEDIIFDAKLQPAHQEFEKVLFILYGLVDDGYGTPEGFPKSIFHQLMLSNMGEVAYPGFVGWATGLAAKIAGWIAKVTGEQERLTVKYYGRPITDGERMKWKLS